MMIDREAETPVKIRVDEHVLVITLNRPHVRNALDLPAAEALSRALDMLDDNEGLRCGVILAEGASFCAGMDLKAVAAGLPRPVTSSRGALGIVSRGPTKPLVAGVHGAAMGGGFEIALCCDIIIASEDALFGLPEVRRGQVAGGGGAVRLPRRIPWHIAAEMLLLGTPITARRGMELGLVSFVVSSGDLTDAALGVARAIASNAPLAVQATRNLMHAALDWGDADAIRLQEPIVAVVRQSLDAAEGAAAFAERRPAVWRGR